MIPPAEISRRYSLAQPYVLSVQGYVRETLSAYCDSRSFAFVSRVKTLNSLCEKIESGRFAGWSDIDDLVAFSIVIPTFAEEDSTIEFLTNTFDQVRLRRRGTARKSPQVFRFDSTRFVGKIKDRGRSTEESSLDKLLFEVQVRTAFDHAWIVTTHALTYKTAVIDWKQQRLAAELKATTEKMDLLIAAFQEASVKIPESPWPEIEAKKSIYNFYASAVTNRRLPSELAPVDWSRFIDNVYELGKRCATAGETEPGMIAANIISSVDAELSSLSPSGVPVSLSLWQITLGSLFNRGAILTQTRNYWPLITAELETLYPALRGVRPRFETW